MTPRERPLHARIPYLASCSLRLDGRTRTGFVWNLSQRGLYVQLDAPAEGEVEISLPLPDGGPPIAATGVVTWVNGEAPREGYDLPVGIGLRFVSLPGESRRRIRHVVERYFHQPAESPEPPPGPTRRVRVPYVVPCALVGEFGRLAATTRSLSTLGLFAAVAEPPAVGEAVRIELEASDGDAPFACNGVVAWRRSEPAAEESALPPGCGVRFDRLSEDDAETVARLVAGRLEGSGADAES